MPVFHSCDYVFRLRNWCVRIPLLVVVLCFVHFISSFSFRFHFVVAFSVCRRSNKLMMRTFVLLFSILEAQLLATIAHFFLSLLSKCSFHRFFLLAYRPRREYKDLFEHMLRRPTNRCVCNTLCIRVICQKWGEKSHKGDPKPYRRSKCTSISRKTYEHEVKLFFFAFCVSFNWELVKTVSQYLLTVYPGCLLAGFRRWR